MENHITLSALQGQIRAAIEDRVGGARWVVAEISECKVNYSGHCYLELVERQQEGTAPVAQARAVIWSSRYKILEGQFRFQTGGEIVSGMKVLVRCTVSHHPVYGLSLVVTEIDPSYTLGETERIRRQTIAQLQQEGVFDMNKDFEMPDVLQHIAVISSPNAAGYTDFMQELKASPYRIEVVLFASVMQGDAAEGSIVEALDAVAGSEDEYDAVVIIRGGGSTSDLACFDSYRMCAYIAQFPLPVVTGIGHDKDVSVADMVAHTSLKTPTAVAAFIVDLARDMHGLLDELSDGVLGRAQQTLMMESGRMERVGMQLASRTTNLLHGGAVRLDKLRNDMRLVVSEKLSNERRRHSSYGTRLSHHSTRLIVEAGAEVDRCMERVRSSAERVVEGQRSRLELLSVSVEGMSPKRILSRGYAIIRSGVAPLKGVSSAKVGQRIEIELRDGVLETEIVSKNVY